MNKNSISPAQLRAARLALGQTQRSLAALLGVNRVTVAKWELGRHRIPPAVAVVLWVLRRRQRGADPLNELPQSR